MGVLKSNINLPANSPSTFALLIDNINKMSESEQKALWIELNQERLSILAKEIDNSVLPNNLSAADIEALIAEAKKISHGKAKG